MSDEVEYQVALAKELRQKFIDAQNTLSKGLAEVEEVIEQMKIEEFSTDELTPSSLDAYLKAHLNNWIYGGNPYDLTIPVIVGHLDSFIDSAPIN